MSRDWLDARRILAVRLDSLGDVLMTEPGLAALRADGCREVTLLTSAAGAEAGRLLPSVDAVITYPAPWMKATAAADPRRDLMMIEQLRAASFDAAVIFTVSTQSALPAAVICHLAGIPLRAARSRENPYHLLTDWVAEDEPPVARHEVDRQLSLVRELGYATPRQRIALRIGATEHSSAVARLRHAGVQLDRPWFVLHPGASAPSRRYPPERYGVAAAQLVREDGWQAVVAGAEADADQVSAVSAALDAPHATLVDALTTPQLAAAIGMADLFVGNNSGPMHIAAAMSTPSVVLYAQTNLQHTPWGGSARVLTHDVPCRNCLRSSCPLDHHACLRMIEADAIVDAVRSLVGIPGVKAPAVRV